MTWLIGICTLFMGNQAYNLQSRTSFLTKTNKKNKTLLQFHDFPVQKKYSFCLFAMFVAYICLVHKWPPNHWKLKYKYVQYFMSDGHHWACIKKCMCQTIRQHLKWHLTKNYTFIKMAVWDLNDTWSTYSVVSCMSQFLSHEKINTDQRHQFSKAIGPIWKW